MKRIEKLYKEYLKKIGKHFFADMKGESKKGDDDLDFYYLHGVLTSMKRHLVNKTGYVNNVFIEADDNNDMVSLLFICTTQKEYEKEQRNHVKMSKEDFKTMVGMFNELLETM